MCLGGASQYGNGFVERCLSQLGRAQPPVHLGVRVARRLLFFFILGTSVLPLIDLIYSPTGYSHGQAHPTTHVDVWADPWASPSPQEIDGWALPCIQWARPPTLPGPRAPSNNGQAHTATRYSHRSQWVHPRPVRRAAVGVPTGRNGSPMTGVETTLRRRCEDAAHRQACGGIPHTARTCGTGLGSHPMTDP